MFNLPEGLACPLAVILLTYCALGWDSVQVTELLRQAESRLGFLKMATPRNKVGSTGSTRAVYRDGRVMEGEEARKHDKARHSNWDGRNLDPDSVRFHKQNLARAGFANHQQVIGPHGF